jgi:Na+-translocating ferredoxin:NAD+ oxidoreductase RnfG subunit
MSAHDDWVRFIAAPVAVFSAAGAVHAAQYLTVEQAQKAIFGAAAQFERRSVQLDKPVSREIEKISGVKLRFTDVPVWQVSENGRPAGWFFVDEVYGKHEFITYAVGLDAEGRVRQIEILDYRETYGYQVREAAWRAQFAGKTLADPLKLDGDIQNIAGATLSCRHLAEGVKRILAIHDKVLRQS